MPDQEINPLYWRLGLPCLLLPGLLLLALMPYYYMFKGAQCSPMNILGACGLAAIFPVYILAPAFLFMIYAMDGTLNQGHIQKTKLLMPFTLGE